MPATRPADEKGVLSRVQEVRMRTFGSKGMARFARALNLSPSTYRAYETKRLPPMPVLVRMSEVSGIDLRWLLTGEFPTATLHGGTIVIPAPQKRIMQRFAERLDRRSKALGALTALLDLLDDVLEVQESLQQKPTDVDVGARRRSAKNASLPGIPVLGRTAAGVPHFWRQKPKHRDLLVGSWRFPKPTSQYTALMDGSIEGDDESSPATVRLLQFCEPVPVGEVSVSEFLSAPSLRKAPPNAFALRIDGESMSPMIRHGDLVILSPDQPARPGRPAVVKLAHQMGVACKVFRREGSHIRLIPINESFPITKHPIDELLWALAVLYRVRLGKTSN